MEASNISDVDGLSKGLDVTFVHNNLRKTILDSGIGIKFFGKMIVMFRNTNSKIQRA